MATECGLLEESGNKFVVFDFEDILLSQSAATIKSNEFVWGGSKRGGIV